MNETRTPTMHLRYVKRLVSPRGFMWPAQYQYMLQQKFDTSDGGHVWVNIPVFEAAAGDSQ